MVVPLGFVGSVYRETVHQIDEHGTPGRRTG